METMHNSTLAEIELTFPDEGEVLDSRDFTLFLMYFRTIYTSLCTPGAHITMNEISTSLGNYVQQTKRFFQNNDGREVMLENIPESFGDLDMKIIYISKQSPLKIVVVGVPVALAIAVIFSGGEIKMPGFEAQVPAIGEGVASMRKALGFTEDSEPSSKETKVPEIKYKSSGLPDLTDNQQSDDSEELPPKSTD